MKKPLVLPKFKNEEEEVKFWDKIDLTEYFEPSDFKRVVFPNLKRTKRLISIRLPEELISKVKEKAGEIARKSIVKFSEKMRRVSSKN